MVYAISQSAPYQTRFSDGQHQGLADTTAGNGGQHSGFRPHDLLEAAVASCINMTVRMYADRHAIPLGSVTVKVSLDRGHAEEAVFRYEVDFDGELSPAQKDRLLHAAHACPVSRTLSKPIRFERGLGAPGAGAPGA
jgi:putative redox protein